DRAATPLIRAGATALLSAGSSSILAVGTGPDSRGYAVGLRDPFDHQRRLGTVRLRSAALALTGISEQSFTPQANTYRHIIDPRSGWRVQGRAYVAVIAPDAALADALATAIFVGGPAVAGRLVRKHSGVTSLLIDTPLSGHKAKPLVVGETSAWSEILGH